MSTSVFVGALVELYTHLVLFICLIAHSGDAMVKGSRRCTRASTTSDCWLLCLLSMRPNDGSPLAVSSARTSISSQNIH